MKDPRTGIGVGVGLGFEGVPRLFLVPLSGASVFSPGLAWAGLGSRAPHSLTRACPSWLVSWAAG